MCPFPHLTEPEVKEELGLCYICALASRHHLKTEITPRRDKESIDITITGRTEGNPDETDLLKYPKLKIQLKSTSTITPNATHYPVQLPRKNYDDLRARSETPQVLVLYLLPTAVDQWVSLRDNEITLRRCAFWLNLLGAEAIESESKVVHIPVTNVFNAVALDQLLERASRGEGV